MQALSRFATRYRNELGLIVAILFVVAFTATLSDAYRQKPAQNAGEILRQASLLGVFAIGAAVIIISGGIDLSAGSVIAFSASVCGAILLALAPLDSYGNPELKNLSFGVYAAAIGGTFLTGVLIGTLHTWLITVIGLPPFIATLASLVGLRSLAKVFVQTVTGALTTTGSTKQIYIHDQNFRELGKDWPIPLAIFLVLSAAVWLLMSRTVVGRHLYAMGGNESAARLSGIRTDRLKWLAYSLSAVTASIAGILYFAEVGTADPQVQGRGYELNGIASAVVGGCSLQGGSGTIPGTMLGVLFLRVVIDSVAKVIKVGADDYEGIIVGLLVVLAVAFNELRKIARGTRKQFFPGALGLTTIPILAGLAGMLTTIMAGKKSGVATLVGTIVLLGLVRIWEQRSARASLANQAD